MKEKIIIYQTFPRLFGNTNKKNKKEGTIYDNGSGKMTDYTDKALKSIKELGCNYIWYTGLIQHASKTDYSEYEIATQNKYVVKGEAGSPYAIADYYSVSPDLALDVNKRMKEFDALVKRTHKAGMKVIIDFVPNHVAREYHSNLKPKKIKDLGEKDDKKMAFSADNNFYYIPEQGFAPHLDLGSGDEQYIEFPAKATGNDCFHAYPGVNDWYETVKLNYGIDFSDNSKHFDPIPDTWHKMLDILMYWASKKIDGFRCDMAHMVPIEFWHWAVSQVKKKHQDIIFIAEIYQPELYDEYIETGLFDYLYDKVGLYDTLKAVVRREIPAYNITNQWQAVDKIQKHMLNFLENHDEQRIASDFFIGDPFKALPALIISATMNTNPFMLYFGEEIGEPGMDEEGFSGKDGRTTIFDYWSVDKIRRWNNNGAWDSSKLTAQEKKLRDFHQKLLTHCNSEMAIREGLFFDLTYANFDNDAYNTALNYAYLRKSDNELIVVITNFDDKKSVIGVKIPNHAFEYLKIKPGKYTGTDILTDKSLKYSLFPDNLFVATVPANSGILIKFNLNGDKDEKTKKIEGNAK